MVKATNNYLGFDIRNQDASFIRSNDDNGQLKINVRNVLTLKQRTTQEQNLPGQRC